MRTNSTGTKHWVLTVMGVLAGSFAGAFGGMYGGFFGTGVGDSLPEYFLVFLGAVFFILLGPWAHIHLPRPFLPPAIINMVTWIVVAGCFSLFLGIMVEKLTGMVSLAAIVGALIGALSQVFAVQLTSAAEKLVLKHPRLLSRMLVLSLIVFVVMFIWTALAFTQ
jgi:hypothetical protein